MIDAACMAISQVSGIERFDRLVDAELGHASRQRGSRVGLEGLVKHRRAPTCVETHVKTSIEFVKAIYRLPLTAWRHTDNAHRASDSALGAKWSDTIQL